jgi:hypothetical protein
MFLPKFGGDKNIQIWNCILWIFEHKQYMGISLALVEYLMKMMMLHSTEEEKLMYKKELELIGIDVDHIDWGHAITDAMVRPTTFGKYRSLNFAWYMVQKLPIFLKSMKDIGTWDVKLMKAFNTSNPVSVIISVVERINSLSNHAKPSKEQHERMGVYIQKNRLDPNNVLTQKAHEVYGFQWIELCLESVLSKIKKYEENQHLVTADLISNWLDAEYIYWKQWADKISVVFRK